MRIVGIAITTSLLYACAAPSGESTTAQSGSEAQTTQSEDLTDLSNGAVVEASMPLPQGQDAIDRVAEQLTLRQQATRMMVQTHVFNAQTHFKNGQLELALSDLEAALSLDDSNLEAQSLSAEIQGLMGHVPSGQRTLGEAMEDQHKLRVQQLQGRARDFYNKGQLALSRKDYNTAVAELTLAVSSIRVAPYALDWDGLDSDASELLQRAKDERTQASERIRLQSEQEAFNELRAAELGEARRRTARVNTMIVDAIEAFDARDYESAISYADLALRRAPRNERALEIKSAAFQAGRKQLNRRYIEERRDEFARWKQYLRELEIPRTDIVTLPDVDDWREMTERRKGRRGQDLARSVDPAEQELRERMQSTFVTLPGIEDEDSLGHLVDILRSFSDLPMVVDPAAEDAVASAGITFTLDFPNRITVRQALDFLATEAGEEVTWTVRHETIMITTREKARGKLSVHNHDVQSLVVGLTDFTGPRIDKIRLYDELDADEDGGGPFGGTLEARRVIEIENLSTLIQENVAPETWSDDGVSIESGEGFIVVSHTLAVQQAIRAFLEDLRRLNSTLVTIESKFMTVGESFIQEIGNDFRGLDGRSLEDLTNGLEDQASRGLDNGGTGSTGSDAAGAPSAGFFFDDGQDGSFAARTGNFFGTALGESLSTIGGMTFQWNFFNDSEVSTILRAVEKSNRYEIINNQMLSVHNTSRAYVAVVNQRAFIQDFSVEVAQFQAVADPEINVLHEGIALDVRPTIQHDRKYLKLEVQPTIATVVNMRTFSTTLGGNTSPVEFQLPELEVQTINTSATLPDGGSVLLGGLSTIRNVERRAEVPWIARVPILGFLFKSEGYNDERESLMILIRAHITDVHEEAQKLERLDN
ncbi:MAG: hypothetical protein GY930_01600 [bacterium]|nr:hypothetical protein [bacterium]